MLQVMSDTEENRRQFVINDSAGLRELRDVPEPERPLDSDNIIEYLVALLEYEPGDHLAMRPAFVSFGSFQQKNVLLPK